MDIVVFVDESGSIPHEAEKCGNYFVISMVFTNNPKYVSHIYKKARLKTIRKYPKLIKALVDTREIKGSSINEALKAPIYSTLLEKCSEHFEVGIILLDLKKCDDNFRVSSSRAFNFLIKRYLETWFKSYNKFGNIRELNFVIDERNVATQARYMLEEYLNVELNLFDRFSENDIAVKYSDSKNYLLLQMSDFIANTYYRYYQGYNPDAFKNMELLKSNLCHFKEYVFPIKL